MTASTCVLCGAAGPLDRQSGFDICERCRLGRYDNGLARWGLTLHHEYTTRTTGSGESRRTVFVLEARVDFPTPISATAHFRREGGFDRFWKMFRNNELQAGDPLFDRAVFIEDADGEQLADLLQDEGIQGAILELVFTGGVRLGEGWVRARRSSGDAKPPLADLAVDLILLAVHLETHAQLHSGQPGA